MSCLEIPDSSGLGRNQPGDPDMEGAGGQSVEFNFQRVSVFTIGALQASCLGPPAFTFWGRRVEPEIDGEAQAQLHPQARTPTETFSSNPESY